MSNISQFFGLNPTYYKPKEAHGDVPTTLSAQNTLVNYTGAGKLVAITVQHPAAGTGAHGMRVDVNIDGYAFSLDAVASAGSTILATGAFGCYTAASNTAGVQSSTLVFNAEFETNLSVTLTNVGTSTAIPKCSVTYCEKL